MAVSISTKQIQYLTEQEFKNKIKTELWQFYSDLVIENHDLRCFLGATIAETNRLKSQINDMSKLKEEILSLQQENEKLRQINLEQNNRITVLEMKISKLEERDDPITIREALSKLEQKILFEILGGNKTTCKKYGGLRNLLADSNKQLECDAYYKKYKITENHIYHMLSLKDKGNRSAHNRSLLSFANFLPTMNSILEDQTDVIELQQNSDIVKLLQTYYPVPMDTSAVWNIQ